MQITKIEIGIPQGSVDNQDVLELLKHYSDLNDSELERKFHSFTERTGAKHRFWREDSSEPYLVLQNTSRRLFEKFDPNLIDIVISCSASKYFAEPAHASIFCNKLGLTPSLAFDVSDGCVGWITAIEALQGFVEPNKNKYALIISHEFPMGEKIGAIYPSAFKINDIQQLDFKLPALTVGEA
jgi:3-oxoacyl-[acyl-carrier-protein] synthase III